VSLRGKAADLQQKDICVIFASLHRCFLAAWFYSAIFIIQLTFLPPFSLLTQSSTVLKNFSKKNVNMMMPAALAEYIIKYGYLAVFSLIFVQELGAPNPVPNELILLFAGYLSSIKVLNFYLIFLVGVSADFIGTSALYAVFYFFGDWILKRAPSWLPVQKIENIKQRVAKRSGWGVFLGRLLPYLRGYASVAAGLLKIPPKKFLPSVIVSAVIWSGGYVILGRILGKEWDKFASGLNLWEVLIIVIGVIVLIFYAIPTVIRRIHR
jgi:membrane protein DedA with SNARE-associated domain